MGITWLKFTLMQNSMTVKQINTEEHLKARKAQRLNKSCFSFIIWQVFVFICSFGMSPTKKRHQTRASTTKCDIIVHVTENTEIPSQRRQMYLQEVFVRLAENTQGFQSESPVTGRQPSPPAESVTLTAVSA